MDKQKKFYKIDTEFHVTNVNIDYIQEWRINWEGELQIALCDGTRYEIPLHADGYPALLKALKERTVR